MLYQLSYVGRSRPSVEPAPRATVELGSDYLGGVLYGVLGRHDAVVSERGYANAVEAMQELCANAEREGVNIGLDVVNRYESNVFNTTEQGLRFLDDIGAGNVSLHLDTYHMNIEEAGMAAAIELWRETWDDGMQLALSARRFVLDELAAATP